MKLVSRNRLPAVAEEGKLKGAILDRVLTGRRRSQFNASRHHVGFPTGDHGELAGEEVAGSVAGLALFVALDGLEVLVFHRGIGECGDGDAEKIFEGLAAADAGALGEVFELVEERLGGRVPERFAGQRAARNDVGLENHVFRDWSRGWGVNVQSFRLDTKRVSRIRSQNSELSFLPGLQPVPMVLTSLQGKWRSVQTPKCGR